MSEIEPTRVAAPTVATAQPGWYPDPMGAPAQLRWHDGTAWTPQLSPMAAPAPAPAPTIVVAGGGGATAVVTRGPNHVLHLILTLVTFGLWLPVWILVALFGRRSTVVAAGGGGGTVVVAPQPQAAYGTWPSSQ